MNHPTYPQAPTGWKRCSSVSRPSRWFYHNLKLKVSVVRSWTTDNWLVSVDGHGIQSGEFATALEAIASVERNSPAPVNPLLARLRHHVTGAIERGEGQAIAGIPAPVREGQTT